MELPLLTDQDLEPLPEPGVFNTSNQPGGLLCSTYKTIVAKNLKHMASKSLFGVKHRLKMRRYRFTSGAEVLLKVSLFTAIIVAVFS